MHLLLSNHSVYIRRKSLKYLPTHHIIKDWLWWCESSLSVVFPRYTLQGYWYFSEFLLLIVPFSYSSVKVLVRKVNRWWFLLLSSFSSKIHFYSATWKEKEDSQARLFFASLTAAVKKKKGIYNATWESSNRLFYHQIKRTLKIW